MEITKLCLLPQKNIRSILNRLTADGVVKLQEMPIKATGGNTGSSGGLLMYGANIAQLSEIIGANIAKTIFNVLLRNGKLSKINNLTLEFNHLAL
jgi:hypothetical protein